MIFVSFLTIFVKKISGKFGSFSGDSKPTSPVLKKAGPVGPVGQTWAPLFSKHRVAP